MTSTLLNDARLGWRGNAGEALSPRVRAGLDGTAGAEEEGGGGGELALGMFPAVLALVVVQVWKGVPVKRLVGTPTLVVLAPRDAKEKGGLFCGLTGVEHIPEITLLGGLEAAIVGVHTGVIDFAHPGVVLPCCTEGVELVSRHALQTSASLRSIPVQA